jgi:hypothetical protein
METTLAIVGPFGRYAAGAMEARAKRDQREAKRMVVMAYLTNHGAAPESIIAQECKGLSPLRAIQRFGKTRTRAEILVMEPTVM